MLRHVFINNRFFIALIATALCFVVSFVYSPLFLISKWILVLLIMLLVADILFLFLIRKPITCVRKIPRVLSLGSDNTLTLLFENTTRYALQIKVFEELPFQLQKRNFEFILSLAPSEKQKTEYTLKPLIRGEYEFGHTIVLITSKLKFIERRLLLSQPVKIPVYPSLIQMRKYELMTMASIAKEAGENKLRRLGQSYELEHIKTYAYGDDYRHINWKATGRRRELMINRFEEERSQQVYCILDAGRNMLMPFEGMSLLDYSVNASLVISNTVLHKQDKAGLIVFSEKINASVPAVKERRHLARILQELYKLGEGDKETDYGMLFYEIKKSIKARSLLFLFTNFESHYSLERVLDILKRINATHLLVLIFFENNEVEDYSKSEAKNTEEIFLVTIAKKYMMEKRQIISQLQRSGIQVIYTRPEQLTINTLNKYLELKARGLI